MLVLVRYTDDNLEKHQKLLKLEYIEQYDQYHLPEKDDFIPHDEGEYLGFRIAFCMYDGCEHFSYDETEGGQLFAFTVMPESIEEAHHLQETSRLATYYNDAKAG